MPPIPPIRPLVTPVALVAGQPVTTTDSQLLVAGIQNAGVYTFQLVVTDDLGVSSKPAQFRVQVTALA